MDIFIYFFICWFLFLTGTVDEYRLLERMNRVTLTKYTEMREISSHLTKAMADLKVKCMHMQ